MTGKITTLETLPCDDMVDYMWWLGCQPYVARWCHQPTPSKMVQFVIDWKNGLIRVFLAAIDGEPVGVMHLNRDEEFPGVWFAHCAFDRVAWGRVDEIARQAVRLVTEPIEIFIPKANRLALALGRRIGRAIGTREMGGGACVHFQIDEVNRCHS